MDGIQILDCTLRDGGYCNQWAFGQTNINKIVDGLIEAGIDIIECGFITSLVKENPDTSKFSSVEKMSTVLPSVRNNTVFVGMINYGEFDIHLVPDHDKTMIDGIRVAFHKRNLEEALDYCYKVKSKGYKVFVQAMVSMAYSDSEFLKLISEVNKLNPYAFYIVDSFGMMKKKDMIGYYSLVEKNLNRDIRIGFHSHNNLQLAYSNTLSMLEMRCGRNVIIDSTVYGMGRGAGNLNTELFVEHMNMDYSCKYEIKPLLRIMDEVISLFYRQNPWGYSLPNYLSAIHNTHPNYARYFDEKNTLTVDMMDDIFARMDNDKKIEYDKQYAEQVYIQYMSAGKARKKHYDEFVKMVSNKEVILIAPGKSSSSEQNHIMNFIDRNDVISIAVNFCHPTIKTDYIFVSNNIRFRELPKQVDSKFIITSNIPDDKAYLQINYNDLLNNDEFVRDNAGLMLIKFFCGLKIKKIYLAGFDGYSYDILENYSDSQRILITKKAAIDATNNGMSNILKELSSCVEIEFITPPIHYQV